jgi:hypothetical protein
MIREVKAYQTVCSVCDEPAGIPRIDLDVALCQADSLVSRYGWERDGDKLVCPTCARRRWHAKHSLVSAGCSAQG